MKMSMSLAVAVASGLALAAQAADQVDRAYAADLLADSAARTLALADDAPAPKVIGNFQTRYYGNFGSDKLPAGSEDFANGFQMRRVRIGLEGQIGSKAWTYSLQGEFSRSTGSFNLVDTYGQYNMDNGWSVRFGQFKLPLYREWLVSHTRQQTVERSVVNTVFGTDYSQGVQAQYTADSFRVTGAFSDGIRTTNTDFTDSTEADFALTGRVEYKWAGEWKQFDSHTSFKGSTFGGMVGGAIHYQDGGSTFNTTDASVLQYALDATVSGDGWNAFAQFVGRSIDPATGPSQDDFGFIIQGGYLFTEQLEGFARYAGIVPDSSFTNDDLFNEFTFGANYYFIPNSNAVKFSADLVLAPQDTTGSLNFTSTGTGLVATTDGQYVLRAQLQMIF